MSTRHSSHAISLARAANNPKRIIPLAVERILVSDFRAELKAWMGEEG